MGSPVKLRPTYYDNLGLTPAATPYEIAEAFAKQIGITFTTPEEAVEHADRIYIAYETLRDPIKRRAYDAAIGLWDEFEAAKPRAGPFIGVKAPELPEHGLHDASAEGTSEPRQKDRRRARRASKTEWPVPKMNLPRRAATHVASIGREPEGVTSAPAKGNRRPGDKPTTDRQLPHPAGQGKSEAAPRATEPVKDKLRGDALQRPHQAKTIPANQRSIKRNSDGTGAGVFIVTLGILTLVVSLTRGNPDHIPRAPRQTPITDNQPVHSTARAAAEQAVPIEEAAPHLAAERSAPATVPILQLSPPSSNTLDSLRRFFAPSATAQVSNLLESGDGPAPPDVGAGVISSGFVEIAPKLEEATQLANDLRPEADLFSSIPIEQVIDRQATDLKFEQGAIRQAAATPSQQSSTKQAEAAGGQLDRKPALTPRPQPVSRATVRTAVQQSIPGPVARASPQPTAHGPIGSSPLQRVYRQAASTPPQRPLARTTARTPPQRAVYRQAATSTPQKAYGQVVRPRTQQSAYRYAARIPRGQKLYRQTPAKWLAGALVNGDNPGGRFRGTVHVQFTVQTNGRVTGCRATSSTRNRTLEARTCGLVEKRLLFSPALDSLGRRIPSILQTSYTWGRVV